MCADIASILTGNGRKAVKHGPLLQLVTQAIALAPSKDPFLYSAACLETLGGGAFTPDQQNKIGYLFLAAIDQCQQDPTFAKVDFAPSRIKAAALASSAFLGAFALESRLVVRIAAVFGVKSPDLSASGRAAAPSYSKRLIGEKNYAAGMGLVQQLELGSQVGEALLLQMIDDGAASAAVDWAKQFGPEVGKQLVARLAERGDHKTAWQLIEKLGLQESFPDAYIKYR